MNNNKLIDQLTSGNQEKAFRYLYKNYPKIEAHIKKNSGTKAEALDIFQDALVVLYKKLNQFKSDTEIKVEGFLVNTCKLLWNNELKKKKVRKNDGGFDLSHLKDQDEIETIIQKESQFKVIDKVIKKLGDTCKNMLLAFYYKRKSMEAIAKSFGYKSVQSAKTKKYKCMEQARNLAAEFNTITQ